MRAVPRESRPGSGLVDGPRLRLLPALEARSREPEAIDLVELVEAARHSTLPVLAGQQRSNRAFGPGELGRRALVVVESGSLEVRGAVRRSVSPGELLLLSGDQPLMVHADEDAVVDVLLLHPRFLGETLHWLFPVVGGWPSLLRSMQLQLDAAEVFRGGPEQSRIRCSMAAHAAGLPRGATGQQMAIASALLAELRDALSARLRLVLPHDAEGGAAASVVPRAEARQAQEILDQRYAEQWSNERLADEIGISVSSLRRVFQQSLRLAPMEYLREVRRGQFEQLLTLGEIDIEQAARSVGLVSTGHLRDFIRKQYGMSPKELREHARRVAS